MTLGRLPCRPPAATFRLTMSDTPNPKHPMSRRRFLGLAGGGTAALACVGTQLLTSCGDGGTGPGPGLVRTPLPTPSTLSPTAATLTAAPGSATIASGETSSAWLFNGLSPSPTIRVRRGDTATIRLVNGIPEPTIVHWHGLIVPHEDDGHPRDAVDPSGSYDYDFPIVQRAGTFWYHPHPHGLTGEQVQRGLAGFFLVGDEGEDALDLPSGEQEILLLLQDRDPTAVRAFDYNPTPDDLHLGILRDTAYGNGVRRPTVRVAGPRCRLRVLNASNARVYRLGLGNGAPLTVIGNDGGLLASAVQADSVYLGVAERIDLLIDLTGVAVEGRLMLESLAFEMSAAPSGSTQGIAMELLEIVRAPGGSATAPPLPATLSTIAPLGPPEGDREFAFQSRADGHTHTINGLTFDMDRVDQQIALGRVERWRFRNDSSLPHPVHLHGTQFQVESREGGRGTVYPYERGWKDTVLVMPLELVSVLVRFDTYRGVFPLHCHNLQHEDLGMMLNVEVV